MILTREERFFVLVCIINFLIATLYLLISILIVVPARTRKERRENLEIQHDNRRTCLIRYIVMVICPVVGPLFFFISYGMYRLLFWTQPDLEDVIFSKERVKTQLKADEERERDIVPLEEAISVNEKKDLRMVMLNTLRGDIQNSLSAIMLALNSEDSESSHYAASVLSSELNEFRIHVQKMYKGMKEETSGQMVYEEMLIDYMDPILKQQIFTKLEQKKLIGMMEEAAESLYEKDAGQMTEPQYEGVCLRLLEIQEFERSERWALRLAEQYPDSLVAYTCKLKLYFTLKNRTAFFETMEALKQSDIIIDNETLEMIRIFS